MAFEYYNPNPSRRNGIDCAVRALSKALNMTWEEAYTLLCTNGFTMYDMPNATHIVNATLRQQGFERHIIPSECPDCYTAEDFVNDHPEGLYILAFDNHICCAKDGTIFDSWNSSSEIPLFYWIKIRKEDD